MCIYIPCTYLPTYNLSTVYLVQITTSFNLPVYLRCLHLNPCAYCLILLICIYCTNEILNDTICRLMIDPHSVCK